MSRIKSIAVYPMWVDVTVKMKSSAQIKNLARNLQRFAADSICQSRAFRGEGTYLSVKVKTVTLPSILGAVCEHGDGVYIGKTMPSVLAEHASIICNSDAIKRFSVNG